MRCGRGVVWCATVSSRGLAACFAALRIPLAVARHGRVLYVLLVSCTVFFLAGEKGSASEVTRLIEPPAGSVVGERVTFDGYPGRRHIGRMAHLPVECFIMYRHVSHRVLHCRVRHCIVYRHVSCASTLTARDGRYMHSVWHSHVPIVLSAARLLSTSSPTAPVLFIRGRARGRALVPATP